MRNTSKRSRTSTRQGEGTWPRLRMANGEWRITLDSPFRYTSVCVPVQSVTLTNYHMMNYQKNNQSNRQINNSEFLHWTSLLRVIAHGMLYVLMMKIKNRIHSIQSSHVYSLHQWAIHKMKEQIKRSIIEFNVILFCCCCCRWDCVTCCTSTCYPRKEKIINY